MKIRPRGDAIGVPAALAAKRRLLARAVLENDAAALGDHFRAWREWIVRVENDASEVVARDAAPTFSWTIGASSCARFETACLAYAYARALFRSRAYALAHAHFGLALEEVMQCRDPLPLSARACGAFRLRCLVRAQRLAICELRLEDDGPRMLSLATWLVVGLREYSRFPGSERKEPLGAGESLLATARAAMSGGRACAAAALEWNQNPFHLEMLDVSRRGARRGAEPEPVCGAFDWERFVGGRPYSA